MDEHAEHASYLSFPRTSQISSEDQANGPTKENSQPISQIKEGVAKILLMSGYVMCNSLISVLYVRLIHIV